MGRKGPACRARARVGAGAGVSPRDGPGAVGCVARALRHHHDQVERAVTVHIHANAEVAAVAPLVRPVKFIHARPKEQAVRATNRAGLLVKSGVGRVAGKVVGALTRLLVRSGVRHVGEVRLLPSVPAGEVSDANGSLRPTSKHPKKCQPAGGYFPEISSCCFGCLTHLLAHLCMYHPS